MASNNQIAPADTSVENPDPTRNLQLNSKLVEAERENDGEAEEVEAPMSDPIAEEYNGKEPDQESATLRRSSRLSTRPQRYGFDWVGACGMSNIFKKNIK